MYLLTRAIGVNRALDLALLGKPVSATEALSIGIVKAVHPDAELMEKATAFANKLAKGPALSYKYIKSLTFESEYRDFETFVKSEVAAQVICSESEDFKEGVMAFAEKRKATFL